MRERFWSKVDSSDVDGCWPWKAGRFPVTGYGAFWLDGNNRQAHIIAYRLARELVPDGLEVHHHCRNKTCCNPLHLEVLTQKEHSQHHRPSVCLNGHPLSGDNARVSPRGWVRCRTCERERMRERRKALKCQP